MTPGKAAIIIVLVFTSLPGLALGQIPGIGGGTGSVPGLGSALGGATGIGGATGLGGASSLAGAAGAAAPKGLCAGLKTCLAGCKQKICASPLGSLINNALTPYSTLSGGLIPQFCPTVPSDADIAALAAQGGPNGAGAVAAKVKQDEADAKARRAAVRYLGTVDCHYWPDAEAAIISALRDDRNECVRFEAALALLNGCCCNARTIEALNIVVAGTDTDGKPSETSERVRCVALSALQKCLFKYTPDPVPPPEAAEPLEAPRPLSALDPAFRRVAYYYQTLPTIPTSRVVANARLTLARAQDATAKQPRATQPGERSVYHALARAGVTPVRPPATNPGESNQVAPVLLETGQADDPAGVNRASEAATSAKDDRAVLPASAPPTRPAAAHRGLFGIIRDSARPQPGI